MIIKLMERCGKIFAIGNEKFLMRPTLVKTDNADTESTIQKDQVRNTKRHDGVVETEDVPKPKP